METQKRICKECGVELSGLTKGKMCDNCRNKRRETRKKVVGGILAGGSLAFGIYKMNEKNSNDSDSETK